MEIAPRYDGLPVIALEGGLEVGEALLRQHARLLETVDGLTDEQWRTPSRCEGWTVQDLIGHLVDVNGFWAISITSALSGAPTRFLQGFDPKATPAALVAANTQGQSPQETLEAFRQAVHSLANAVRPLTMDEWEVRAEAPPGHMSIRLLAHHAVWDSWVHERDIDLPLGITPPADDDEVRCSLRYVAALGPTFAVMQGRAEPDTVVVRATGPDTTVVVEVDADSVRVHDGPAPDGALVIEGAAIDLIERLSVRDERGVDVPADRRWLTSSLAEVFQ